MFRQFISSLWYGEITKMYQRIDFQNGFIAKVLPTHALKYFFWKYTLITIALTYFLHCDCVDNDSLLQEWCQHLLFDVCGLGKVTAWEGAAHTLSEGVVCRDPELEAVEAQAFLLKMNWKVAKF